MKKVITMLLFMGAISILLSSCRLFRSERTGSDVFGVEDSNTESIETTSEIDQPLILYFDAVEDIFELDKALEKNDEDFDKYIKRCRFTPLGIRSREEYKNELAKLNEIYLPVRENVKIEWIAYYVELSYIMLLYDDPIDTAVFIDIRKNSGNNVYVILDSKKNISLNLILEMDGIKYYQYIDEDNPTQKNVVYVANVNGYFVQIQAQNDDNSSKPFKALTSISFEKVNYDLEKN